MYNEVISTAKLFYTRVGPLPVLYYKKKIPGRSTKRSGKLSIIKPIKADSNSNKSSITSDKLYNFVENLIQEFDQNLGSLP